MALMVVKFVMVIGPLYSVPADSLGVLPSRVYRINAPDVAVLIDTVWPDEHVPAAGLNDD
jgi:hypothetical protein